jgi:hypothetical protein
MTDFNMPPGVSVNDIPGNRPEDLAEDAFWDKIGELAPADHLPEEWWDDTEGIVALVNIVRDLAYRVGYEEGRAEAELAAAATPFDD